ncbi:class II aldolase/adducin family protein [Brevibacillus laterosporus]|uniref:class II aldolase/adducin family protein n=1 Tax=Brevibacillus laterosporus TaxID=1465 RepID=UPI00264AF3E6|nr:class II aldolase/adducin family protein [Brevibacillus laterosporus]MDN9012009.1 class II aldolase/adducin family protein [Brevibacillus laterosporus]MDO0943105.1 class II aldolase/adducin family protein [Brevibacillus laterosporus]
MKFSFVGQLNSPNVKWFADGINRELVAERYQYCEESADNIRIIFNFVDQDNMKPYRRKAQATFCAAVIETNKVPDDIIKEAYPILIRTLSNLLIYIIRSQETLEAYFITLERGCYSVPYTDTNDELFFSRVKERLIPIASSRLVINNEFHCDLPEELWNGDEKSAQLIEAGSNLDALDLLPAPFPMEELLNPQDFRHVKRLFGIGGLSYGNLSVRKEGQQFWMSASGVNKGDMQVIGRDILLVMGYNEERNAMLLNIPPHIKPRRVSVDAIEHWMIYTRHPEVEAIIHIHAWMDGVHSTEINYPCGTWELAKAVSDLVSQADDPSRAIIGLKNHGLTITGTSLEDIFERIDGRIIRQVPMT